VIQTLDKVVGLNSAPTIYMTKPFEAPELIARIQTHCDGCGPHWARVHQFGTIRVDVQREKVLRNGKPVELTSREFQLLYYLMERAGSTVPRTELLQSVWGHEDVRPLAPVDAHVSSLRRKLEYNPKRPELILTTPGVGYKFVGPSQK